MFFSFILQDGKSTVVGAFVSFCVGLKDYYAATPARLAEVSFSFNFRAYIYLKPTKKLCIVFLTHLFVSHSQVSQIVLKECNRKQLQYRLEVLPHLTRLVAAHRSTLDFNAVLDVLRTGIEEKHDESSDEESEENRIAKRTAAMGLKEDVKAASLDALAAAWPRDPAKLVSCGLDVVI